MAAQNQNLERAFWVTNIKSHIPIVLDLDDHNYDGWHELFSHIASHAMSLNISTAPFVPPALMMLHGTRDGLVKLWMYGTLAQPLFRSSFKPGGTARDIWLRIENQFRNNKEVCAIQLDNELRTTEIGDQSIQIY